MKETYRQMTLLHHIIVSVIPTIVKKLVREINHPQMWQCNQLSKHVPKTMLYFPQQSASLKNDP